MNTYKVTLGISLVLLIGLFGFLYLNSGAFGSTQIGISLKTNKTLEDGLVGHWTFDGSNIDTSQASAEVRDSSGNGFHGDAQNMLDTDVRGGKIGQAVDFDGVDGTVVVAHNVALDPDYISAGAWIRPDAQLNDYGNIVAKQTSADGWWITVDDNSGVCPNDTICARVEVGASNATVDWPVQYDEWQHAMFTYDGSNIILYVNGVQVDSAADSGTIDSNTTVLCMGGFNQDPNCDSTDGFFDGLIDDVRVYNRALSAAEVQRLYEVGATTKIATTITTNSSLEDGLVAHWTFDGDPYEIEDRAGSVNDALVFNPGEGGPGSATSTFVQNGKIGQSLGRSGGNYIQAADSADFDLYETSDNVTFAGWTRKDGTIGTFGVFMEHDNTYIILENEFNPLEICFRVAGTGNTCPASLRNAFEYGEWAHIAMTYDQSFVRIYQNGEEVYNEAETGAIPATSDQFCVGTGQFGGNCNDYLEGSSVDDVRVYDRALSADEIKRLYQLGATTKVGKTVTTNPDLDDSLTAHWTFDGDLGTEVGDASGNGNVLYFDLNSGTSSTIKSGRIGQAIHLDGTSDYLYVHSDADIQLSSEPNTMSAWFFLDSFTLSNGNRMGVINIGNDSSNGSETGFEIYSSFGEPEIYIYGGGLSPTFTGFYPEVRTWYHVAIVNDSTNTHTYVDGIVVDSSSSSGAPDDFGRDNFSIGGRVNQNQALDREFEGKIDDVRLYDRALTADEVLRLYQLGGG